MRRAWTFARVAPPYPVMPGCRPAVPACAPAGVRDPDQASEVFTRWSKARPLAASPRPVPRAAARAEPDDRLAVPATGAVVGHRQSGAGPRDLLLVHGAGPPPVRRHRVQARLQRLRTGLHRPAVDGCGTAARCNGTDRPRSPPAWTAMKGVQFSGTEFIASYATAARGSVRAGGVSGRERCARLSAAGSLPRRGPPVAVRAVRPGPHARVACSSRTSSTSSSTGPSGSPTRFQGERRPGVPVPLPARSRAGRQAARQRHPGSRGASARRFDAGGLRAHTLPAALLPARPQDQASAAAAASIRSGARSGRGVGPCGSGAGSAAWVSVRSAIREVRARATRERTVPIGQPTAVAASA